MKRFRWLWSPVLLAPILLAGPAPAQDLPDAWSTRVVIRTPDDWYGAPVHGSVLPDGRLHLMGFARDTEDPQAATGYRRASFTIIPSALGQALPPEIVVTEHVEPLDFTDVVFGNTYINDDLFCTGNSLTADGQVFTAGGTRFIYDFATETSQTVGFPYSTLFDANDDTWVRLPADMISVGIMGAPGRWYPAVTRLHDGRMLVTGGYSNVAPDPYPQHSVEVYDVTADSWEIVSPYPQAPFEIFNGNYTHPALLPGKLGDFDLMMFGMDGIPVFLSLDGSTRWQFTAQNRRPGTLFGELPNFGATSALLPIRLRNGEWGYNNGSMLVAGGPDDSSHVSRADVFDPITDDWLPRIAMGVGRHDPTAVLLPDGMVAVVAGHEHGGNPDLDRATYIDPADGFTARFGTSSGVEVRGYHNVVLLLPDGRLFVAGGRDNETETSGEKSSYRYLYPPYMSQTRPLLIYAPGTIRYGQNFPLWSRGERPGEVVLMGLGSMTHSMDFNQRSVQLKIARVRPPLPLRNDHVFAARGPADQRVAPPGYYMLFVLDRNRVPSEAAIVRLEE